MCLDFEWHSAGEASDPVGAQGGAAMDEDKMSEAVIGGNGTTSEIARLGVLRRGRPSSIEAVSKAFDSRSTADCSLAEIFDFKDSERRRAGSITGHGSLFLGDSPLRLPDREQGPLLRGDPVSEDAGLGLTLFDGSRRLLDRDMAKQRFKADD